MTCSYTDSQLNDYADGRLDEPELTMLEQHLETCSSCRQTVLEIRSLLSEAAALPRSLEPERDLWSDVEARIRRANRVVRPSFGLLGRMRRSVSGMSSRTRIVSWVAAAAAVLLVLGVAYRAGVGPEPDPVRQASSAKGQEGLGAAGVASSAERQETAGVVQEEYRIAEGHYAGAVKELLDILEARRGELSFRTLEVVEENLRTIDQAIEQTRAALKSNATDPRAGRMFASMYRRKIELLEMAARLPRHG